MQFFFWLEVNAYVFRGISLKPIGGLFILHGPEAGSLYSFTDIGVGEGMEVGGSFFVDFSRVWTLDSKNIRSDDFGGFRTSGSIDVGLGLLAGLNAGINNPTGKTKKIH